MSATLKLETNKEIDDASRGRLHIPHGRGEEKSFKPHPQHIDVEYSQNGPDWSSRIRMIKQPEKPQVDTIFYPPLPSLRKSGRSNERSTRDYVIYPDDDRPGVKSKFNEQHLTSLQTMEEYSLHSLIGQRRCVDLPSRNGIASASPGDKPYQVPEYSPDFYKLVSMKIRAGKLPQVESAQRPPSPSKKYISMKSFAEKEIEKKIEEERDEVKELENWKPADPFRLFPHLRTSV